jgi:RHS repeat-associated protein
VTVSVTADTEQTYISKERDPQSSSDYFVARYYSPAEGRFTSVDPLAPIIGKQIARDKEAAEREFRKYLDEPGHWNCYPD